MPRDPPGNRRAFASYPTPIVTEVHQPSAYSDDDCRKAISDERDRSRNSAKFGYCSRSGDFAIGIAFDDGAGYRELVNLGWPS